MFVMKTIKTTLALVLAATTLLASCKKDDPQPERTPPEDRISTTLKGEMILSLAGEGEVTIDWGDGEEDEVTLTPLPESGEPGAEHQFKHEYEDDDRKNISFTVDGEITAIATGKSGAMTVFRVNELAETLEYLDCSGEKLSTLSVSDFRKLRYLDCSANAITRLSVGGCRLLEELDCGANTLTLDAAKAIFRALPDRDGEDEGKMRIANPPAGLIQSDAQVAVDKNWEVTPELPLVYIPPTDPDDPDDPDDPVKNDPDPKYFGKWGYSRTQIATETEMAEWIYELTISANKLTYTYTHKWPGTMDKVTHYTIEDLTWTPMDEPEGNALCPTGMKFTGRLTELSETYSWIYGYTVNIRRPDDDNVIPSVGEQAVDYWYLSPDGGFVFEGATASPYKAWANEYTAFKKQ
jgi:hypothetical protein